jgi:hypothetical protein
MDIRNVDGKTKAQAAIQTILQALSGIRYGSLEIIVHDSEVVQVERKEKFRVSPRTGRQE